MRADRLIAALLVLQARGRVTAAQLADELEVSVRTARRDLEALAMSGVPVYPQPGRGGGWQLIGGARTDLTGLSSDESRALFLALSSGPERDPVLAAALRKLVVALPEGFRDEAVAATTAIRVDPTGWGQIGARDRPGHVDVLSRLVVEGRQAVIAYQRPVDDEPHDRLVHPLGLVTKRGVWYLIANTDRGMRTYRVTRVHRVDPLDSPVDRPPDFDLDEQWQRIVTHVERSRVVAEARIRFHPDVAVPVRWIFGARYEEHGTGDDGWTEATVGEGSPTGLAAQLAGFGNRVQIVGGDPAVVDEMRRIAAELAEQWLR